MNNIWITSDTHFSHQQAFLWEPRGFSSVDEMNETIVERWNSIIHKQDIIYHLGDMALNDIDNAIPYIKRLNGQIIWIRGNHDTDNKIKTILHECPYINMACYMNWDTSWSMILKDGKRHLYLSHYPTLTANYDEKHFSQHVISLHGHTHSKDKWMDTNNPFLYNVCLDAHNCYPVALEDIISDIRKKWDSLRLDNV